MMHSDIAHKAIVLKLNAKWEPVHVELVSKTICDLVNGTVKAFDIEYELNEDGTPNFEKQLYIQDVNWETWVTLPVRPWDLVIHTSKMVIRVPTVVVAANYSKIHEKKFRGKPTKETLYMRDNGIDGYTGLEIAYEDATIDHIVPKYHGGTDTYENTVLTTKETNNDKGHRFNSEVGLKLHVQPRIPKPMVASQTIRKVRHHDWKAFVKNVRRK